MSTRHSISTRSGYRSGGTAGPITDYPTFNTYPNPEILNFTILSWNTNGLRPIRSQAKLANLQKMISGWKPDFILLQETHLDLDSEYFLPINIPNYSWSFSHRNSMSRGVAIGIRLSKNVIVPINKSISAEDGKWVLQNVIFKGSNINLVSYYKPPLEGTEALLQALDAHGSIQGNPGLIIGGDFNIKPTTSEMTEALNLLATVNTSPIKSNAPTHIKGNQIDYLFIHDKFTADREAFFETIPSKSDHCILLGGLDRFRSPSHLPTQRIPPGICDNPNFIDECLDLTGNYNKSGCPFDYLKRLKTNIHATYNTWRSESEHKLPTAVQGKRRVLLKLIQYIDRVSANGNLPKAWLRLEPLKSIIIAAYRKFPSQPKATATRRELMTRAKALAIKLHTDIPHLGIYVTAKFRDKPNFQWKPHFRAIIKDEDGLPITDKHQQHESLKKYWEHTFSGPRDWDRDQIQTLLGDRPKIPYQAPVQFAKDEISHFIRKRRQTAPGPDGIPLNFYANSIHHRTMLQLWKALLRRTAIDSTNVPEWFVEGNLVLFPKDNGTIGPDKFRPITVSNGDYRLLMGLWARRLESCLRSWISEPQRALLKGRNIRDCIEGVGDVWFQKEWENQTAHLLQIDFSKAFDFINRKAIKHIMDLIGLPSDIKAAIKHALSPAPTYLCTPGHPPSTITVKNGVKQGCPASPLVFIMVEDLLIYALSNTPEILAIKAYADDIGIVLKASIQPLAEIAQHLRNYCMAVGAQVNFPKCSFLSTKPGTHSRSLPEPWTQITRSDSSEYLGIHIAPNLLERERWTKPLRNADIVARKIRQHDWPLHKRIKMINMFIVSLFTYIQRHYIMPRTVVSKLNQSIRLALGNYRTIPDSILYAVDGPFRLKTPVTHPFFQGIQCLALSPPALKPVTMGSISSKTIYWHQNVCYDIIKKRLGIHLPTLNPPTPDGPPKLSKVGQALRLSLIRTLPANCTWKLPDSLVGAEKRNIIANLHCLQSANLRLTFTLLFCKEWSLNHQYALRTGRTDSKCSLCGSFPETYQHVIQDCLVTKAKLEDWKALWLKINPTTENLVSWPQSGADLIGGLKVLQPHDFALRAHLINLLRATISIAKKNSKYSINYKDRIWLIHGAVNKLFPKAHHSQPATTTSNSPIQQAIADEDQLQAAPPHSQYIGYFDGSGHKFPPVAGAGYVLYRDAVEVAAGGIHLPFLTSNEGESMACVALLKYLQQNKIHEAIIHGDSKIIIDHLKNKKLVSTHKWADFLLPFTNHPPDRLWTYSHLSRVHNKRADAIANAAAISQTEGNAIASQNSRTTRSAARINPLNWIPPLDFSLYTRYIMPLKPAQGTIGFPIPKSYRPPRDPQARWITINKVMDFRETQNTNRETIRIPTITNFFTHPATIA